MFHGEPPGSLVGIRMNEALLWFMYDVERAEVVKGPQGTLFGRNSIAGAVSVITNKPENAFEASAPEFAVITWSR